MQHCSFDRFGVKIEDNGRLNDNDKFYEISIKNPSFFIDIDFLLLKYFATPLENILSQYKNLLDEKSYRLDVYILPSLRPVADIPLWVFTLKNMAMRHHAAGLTGHMRNLLRE